jgi:hypothetical protein
VVSIASGNSGNAEYAAPGGFNDMDMMVRSVTLSQPYLLTVIRRWVMGSSVRLRSGRISAYGL